MLFNTAGEWIALALTLLGGWLLGLASHPGGRKWRTRYATERDAHAATRRDFEAKLTAGEARHRELEAERAHLIQSESRLRELERERIEHEHDRTALTRANERIAELEREVAHLRATPTPVAAQPSTLDTRGAMPLTRRVVDRTRSGRGWFDWGPGSDPRARRG
jgi:septal ring factor EnvC (AmiA/AmiB activator)